MEPTPSFDRDVSEIERKMNAQTQQYLIGQVNAIRARVEEHEKEFLILWTVMTLGLAIVLADDLYIRSKIKEDRDVR